MCSMKCPGADLGAGKDSGAGADSGAGRDSGAVCTVQCAVCSV